MQCPSCGAHIVSEKAYTNCFIHRRDESYVCFFVTENGEYEDVTGWFCRNVKDIFNLIERTFKDVKNIEFHCDWSE